MLAWLYIDYLRALEDEIADNKKSRLSGMNFKRFSYVDKETCRTHDDEPV